MRIFGKPPLEAVPLPRALMDAIRQSVRRKITFLVLVVTFTALLVMASATIVLDLRNYHDTLVADLVAQADLLGRTSAPALAFDDAKSASENLALLKAAPKIVNAAIYTAGGRLFASYASADGGATPAAPGAEGYRTEGGYMVLFWSISEQGQHVGTVYLRARYEMRERLLSYLGILSGVLMVSLLLAIWISTWLQGTVTEPILEITAAARKVMTQRDYSLRVRKTTEDEIGFLVDTFNAMLAEVGQRSNALEESHRDLEKEMYIRRQAEDSLRVADRRKDEFLATLAHELRNPLAPIANALALLDLSARGDDEAKPARQMMQRQLRQLVRLVDDLLDVSRITTGKIDLRPERAALAAIIGSAVETAAPVIQARKHHLDVRLPAEPVYLMADPTRLAQVFLNLLTNASKFTAVGGSIVLEAKAGTPGEVIVSVSDNGIGIEEDMQGMIFEMFAQVDRALERSVAGLGVGLSLARHLVELHHGSLTVYSAGIGHGSTFEARLPALQPQPPSARNAVPSNTADTRPPGHDILLAEDNQDAAESFAMLLELLGHRVRMTHDGDAALARAAEQAPDFAFLDIGLPGRNGYDLARAIRALPNCQHTVLVALTGWGQESDRQQARDAGFNHHLVKPMDLEKVKAILEGRAAP
ncbi:MAG TPA: ATP-binding protein [Burkholderiales bacterium]|jgi:signal transduction histidine kinase/CheY-like chemotaxis protein|nr:ATP-binding protein [Burkholderiales bacterium]